MKCCAILRRAVAVYFLIGLLTWADWHFVWLKGTENAPPPWDRTHVSLFFGPIIALSWPLTWKAYYDLGTWSWLPGAAR